MAEAKRGKIRVGIIGLGRSGWDIHAAHLRGDGRYKIVAAADPMADRRAQAQQELGAEPYDNYRDMLKRDDLDLVVNATPSSLHVPASLDALKTGHNVLCEKPLARRVAQVDKLIAAAKKARKLLAIFQQSRFSPAFNQAMKVIDSGVLGRVVMVKIAYNGFGRRWDWQTLQEFDGGSLLNTGPHPLDQALQFFGPGTPEVKCLMDRANTFGDAEDHVKLLLTGKGRPTIDLEISACCGYSPYTYQVYGTRGGLAGTTSAMSWRYFNPKTAPKQKLIREPLEGRAYCREALKFTERIWAVPKSKANMFSYMSREFYTHLYKTLAEGAPLVIPPAQVRRQIAVIEECHRQNPLSRRKK